MNQGQSEFMTVGEARLRLGISRTLMTKLVREGRIATEPHPLDQRVKLVHRADVEKMYAQLALLPRKKEAPAAA